MKTKVKLKEQFEVFFEKHPNIKELPFIMTIVVPKYESKGERYVQECGELLEDDEIVEKYLKAEYEDLEEFWESFMNDLPNISEKDAFYQFDENTLLVVKNNKGQIEIETFDYSDEIWEMY